jgi:flagellar biosynthesis chaperone FliJ
VSAVEQLDELRRLRVRRAEAQLANWQTRCQQAATELQCAQARVGEALALLEGEAGQLQALLTAGALPVGQYRSALELLDALEAQRGQLAEQADQASRQLAEVQAGRDQAQQFWRRRQLQCEALEPLLQQHARRQQRAAEAREESLAEDRPHGALHR